MCPKIMHHCLLEKRLHIAHACFKHLTGSSGTMGLIFFTNNRSRLPPEGSARKEHLYGIKATERKKEIFLKVGGEGKGGFFGFGLVVVFWKVQRRPLNQ